MTQLRVENIIPTSVRRYVPRGIKDSIRKLRPKTKLQRDVQLFILNGTRFTPPLDDFPPMVMLDTTSRCNLTCTHCPNSALSQEEGFLGDMDMDLIYKVLDEIAEEAPKKCKTRLFNSGEPLIRKDLHEHIRYATSRGIEKVSITTNGTMLVAKRRKQLIEAGLRHLEVSIDAATAPTFLAVRESPLFDRVVENTIAYAKMSRAFNPRNRTIVSFVMQDANRHEVDQFKDFWSDKVDQISIREVHQHNGLVNDHGLYRQKGNPERHPCPYLWDRLIINHDGKVRFCEADWRAEHSIGDIRTQTIKEIWHGQAYTNLRQQHVDGTFEHEFCAQCTDWRQIKWNNRPSP